MVHNTKYRFEDLLGMSTKVRTVKVTTRGKVQTAEVLADSGVSTSIILWDLAKKLNMIIFETGDATLQDVSYKHRDVRGRGEIPKNDEAEARLDKTGDVENEEEAKLNEEGGKDVAEESKLPER